jgi:DNA-binding NarL/FixJ family response regulator
MRAIVAHGEVRTLTLQPTAGLLGEPAREHPQRPIQYGLTPIEWQMIELAVQGIARRHIALQLSLAPSSSSTY